MADLLPGLIFEVMLSGLSLETGFITLEETETTIKTSRATPSHKLKIASITENHITAGIRKNLYSYNVKIIIKILNIEKPWRHMFKLLSKKHISMVLALLSLSTMKFSLMAEECCYPSPCNRFYIGAFGGGNYSNATRIRQTGTAFFTEAQGGPLAVDARGHARKTSSGFGGAQIGYEWLQCPFNLGLSNWNITPAAEIEAYFYSHTKKGHFINPTNRLPEHDFTNTFPMDVGAYFVNGVFTLRNGCLGKIAPYLGGGIGVANMFIRKAKSLQVSPLEPGINHFNSGRSDSAWAFAAQAKAGLQYTICERFHIFAEYRFLFVDSSNYIFGSTNYPTHAPTSTWNVKVNNMWYNAFALGIQFDL